MGALEKILSLVALTAMITIVRAPKPEKKPDLSKLVDDKTLALAQKILDHIKDSKKDDSKPSKLNSKPYSLNVEISKPNNFDDHDDYDDDYDDYDDDNHDHHTSHQSSCHRPQKSCGDRGNSRHQSCKRGHHSHSHGRSTSSCHRGGHGHRSHHSHGGHSRRGHCGGGGRRGKRDDHVSSNVNDHQRSNRRSSNDDLLYPIQKPKSSNNNRESGKGYN